MQDPQDLSQAFNTCLDIVLKGNHLSQEQAEASLLAIGKGMVQEPQIAAFLTCFIIKGVQAYELFGFRQAMLSLATRVPLKHKLIDIVGTGGDGKNTFNISTLSGFVLASLGVNVAKHGNKGVSSACGASDVLQALGAVFTQDVLKIEQALNTANFAYLHAPLFHPAMRFVAPVRQGLKRKTFFNLLGPMLNPCEPSHHLVGVYAPELLDLFAQTFSRTGSKFTIVHATDGYDEVSLTDDALVVDNSLHTSQISAHDFGLRPLNPQDLFGGNSIEEAKAIFSKIIEGKGTEVQNAVVSANVALALRVYQNTSLQEGFALAQEALKQGSARDNLHAFLEVYS